MAYTNLTDAQVKAVNEAFATFPDPVLRNAVLNALDAISGGAAITAVETEVDNLNTWAAALATKLNADAGVTDVDYDTDPQA